MNLAFGACLLLVLLRPGLTALINTAEPTETDGTTTGAPGSGPVATPTAQTSPGTSRARHSTAAVMSSALPWPTIQTASDSSNCSSPVQVSNQFGIPGLHGWDLTSHSNYMNNSASVHEHNALCSWKIQPPDDLIVLLRISHLLLEPSPNCEFDSLSVELVDLNAGKVNESFCGSIENRILLAKSDVSLVFKSDSSVSYRGFHVQWTFVNASTAEEIKNISMNAHCTKVQEIPVASMFGLSAPGGMLVSHDEFSLVPTTTLRGYKDNQNCRWNITLQKDYILLWIRLVHLESSETGPGRGCNYDNLTVHLTDAITGQNVSSTMCSLVQDRTFLTKNSIGVTFRTDSSVGNRGFDLEWLHLNLTQAMLVRQSWSNFVVNTTQSPCTALEPISNLSLGSIGAFPGGQLVSHPEYLADLTSKYRSDTDCRWTIRNPSNLTLIHFKIISVDLEVSSIRSLVCRFDNLTVQYRDALTNRWVSKVACSSLHLAYFTSSSDVSIRFVTDRSVSMRGFHLKWFFIPRQMAYSLPGLESMQSFDCAETNENEGVLVVDGSVVQNRNCRWQWTINDGEIMNISIVYGDIDVLSSLELASPISQSCYTSREVPLKVSYNNIDGMHRMTCFSGSETLGLTATAFRGPLTVFFRRSIADPRLGFVLRYKRADAPQAVCADIRMTSKYSALIEGRINRNLRNGSCEWTVHPLDGDHAVGVFVHQLGRQLSHDIADCTCRLKMTTNWTLDEETFIGWTRRVQANSSDEGRTARPSIERKCCGSRFVSIGHYSTGRRIMSRGPTQIKLSFIHRPLTVRYYIVIRHLPIVTPWSSRRCKSQPELSRRNTVIAQSRQSRIVSMMQVSMASNIDCITGLNIYERVYDQLADNSLRFSLNCTNNDGFVNVVKSDMTVLTINCSSALNEDYPGNSLDSRSIPVSLESVGTGGFSFLLEQLKIFLDIGHICARYDPAVSPWRTYLPFYSPTPSIHMRRIMFYCTIELTPRPGHDLILQLQMPFSNNDQEQFCSMTDSLAQQPRLTLIITPASNNESRRELSLCDHNAPVGGLRLQDRIRISEGGSVTVDMTMAQASPIGLNQPGETEQLMDSDVSAMLLVNQVQVCERLPSSGAQWQMSSDSGKLTRTVTVPPDNTQTDCKLQLDAFSIADIASQTKALLAKSDDVLCWNIGVILDKFNAPCGLKQLLVMESRWDPLAEAVEHRQHEVCGSTAVSYSVQANLKAVGSGLSIQYSGVRSGFRADFSVSACPAAGTTSGPGGSPAAIGTAAPTSLITAIVILLLVNLGVLLFAFRARILQGASLLAGRVQRSRQLVYRAGTDGVKLINEDA